MDKHLIAEAVTEAVKTKDALVPGAVLTFSTAKWISTNIDPILISVGLFGTAVWVWVRIWAHIALTRRTLASPASPVKEEGAEA